MNQRRHKLPAILKLALATAVLLWRALDLAPAHAQQITTLIPFTNIWKFDQSGRELGTAWQTDNYDDSTWPSGHGLLGFDETTATITAYSQHAPINTALTISSTVTTFYFRTTFNFAGSTNALSLVASNLVDDGCAIYLNGLRVGSVRAPAFYNAATLFSGANEGQLDVVALTNVTALRQGANLLAVEVHQSSVPNPDIMWGMKLVAIHQTPLVITNPPQSRIVMVGDPLTLTVGVSGGPAHYRWERNGILQSSTSNTLTIASAQLASAGNYRVIITNAVSAVTSSVATVTVLADTTGPRLLAAIGNNSPPGGQSYGSNTINILFSEPLTNTPATVRNTNNYTLTRLGTTRTVPITNALYAAGPGALLRLDASDPDWTYGADYLLTVSNLRDLRGNVIAPDSQIVVSWPHTASVIPLNHPWRFHNSWIFDPDSVETNWYARDFVENFWWADGYGAFCGGVFSPSPPPNTCIGCATQTGFQPEPALFRTWFHWPAHLPTENTTLRLRFAVDDGAVFYLNGAEIYWYNMPAGTLIRTTKAATNIVAPVCITNVSLAVSNLLPGSNCLAVAVYQSSNATDADTFFALALDIGYLLAPRLPPESEPVLAAALLGTNQLRLAWQGHGYALESATNLNLGPASYPAGPWQQVTNMSNPYTNRLDEPHRFFRLKK